MRGVIAAGRGGHGGRPLRQNRSVAEPPIRSRQDLKNWTVWAKGEAQVYSEMRHPRLKQVQAPAPAAVKQTSGSNGYFGRRTDNERESADSKRERDTIAPITVVKLPLCSSPDDVSEVLGVGVRLYFDLQKLLIGLSLIGILCMLPSYLASFENIGECLHDPSIRLFSSGFPSHLSLALVSLLG